MENNFTRCRLKDILSNKGYIRGPFGSALKRSEMKKKGIPVYEQSNVIHNNRVFRYFIDDEKFEVLKRFQVKKNDLIISCSGTVGCISLIKEDDPIGIISQALLILRPNEKSILPEFLMYFFKSNKGHNSILSRSSGSVQINIAKREVIENIDIDLPKIKEQQKIVSMLSSFDDKIELNNKMNKTLEEIAQAIFKSWFVDFEPFKDGEFEESELGMIPKGWNVGKVGDICDVSSSKRIFMADYREIGIPFYRGKEIIEKSKGNEVSTKIYIDIEKFTEIKSKFGSPTKGDILLTSVGTIGIPYLVKDEEFYFKDGNLTWFKNFKVNGYNLYMYYWIKYGEGKNNIDKITIGSTQKALTISSLKDMKIIIPSDEDIYKFNNYVSGIVKRCDTNINENLYLKSIRDALLPKLISGEIKL